MEIEKNWRFNRAVEFNTAYLKATNKPCPLGMGALIGMLGATWEKYHGFLSPETNAIEFDIPSREEWAKQVHGFFQDKWAREKMNFHFGYFIKNYGKFSVKTVAKDNDEKLQDWKNRMGRA